MTHYLALFVQSYSVAYAGFAALDAIKMWQS